MRDLNRLLSWSFPCGSLFRIAIRIHWSFPVLVLLWSLTSGHPAWTLLLMAALFASVLIHEFGHCFAARAVGGYAREILLWPLGGMAYVGHAGDLRDDLKVTLAGPAVHPPLALLCGLSLMALGEPWNWAWFSPWHGSAGGGFGSWVLQGILKIQVLLFLFNLFLPVYPLDGGRILADLLLMRWSRERAARTLMWVSGITGVLLMAIGLGGADRLLLFIGLLVVFEAWQIRRFLKWGALTQHPMFGRGGVSGPPRGRRRGVVERWRRKGRLRAVSPPSPPVPPAEETTELQRKVDAILEKVSRQGMASLTDEERRTLDRMSMRLREKERF